MGPRLGVSYSSIKNERLDPALKHFFRANVLSFSILEIPFLRIVSSTFFHIVYIVFGFSDIRYKM